MSNQATTQERKMNYKVTSKDNGYFEIVEMTCCGQKYRITTEDYQYGITAKIRKTEREFSLRNHKCS